MIKYIFVIIAILSFGLNSFGSDKEDLQKRSDQVQDIVRSAIKEKDSGKIVSVFSDDIAIITPAGTSFEGKLTIRATLAMLFPFVDSGTIDLTRLTLNIVDDSGYETGKYMVTEALENGKTRKINGRFVIIWEKSDNIWLIDKLITIR